MTLSTKLLGVLMTVSSIAAAQPAPANGQGTTLLPFQATVGTGANAKPVVIWVPVSTSRAEPGGDKPTGLLMSGRNIMTDGMRVGGFDAPGGLNSPRRTLFPSFDSDSRFGDRLDSGRRDPLFGEFFKNNYSYSVLKNQNGGTRPPNRAERERMAAEAYRKMLEGEVADRKALMEGPRPGVTVWSTGDSGAVGLTVGKMKDGRMVLLSGDLGTLDLDALRLEGGYQSELHVSWKSVDLEGHAGARFTLIGVHAETGKLVVGDKMAGFDLKGEGRAGVLADASVDGNLILDENGARAKLGGNAFAGAKAEGEIPVSVSLLGIKFTATPNGYVAAGAGINGEAYAGLSTKGVKAGCKAGACLGLGAGGGVDLEIDVSEFGEFDGPSWSQTWEPPARGPYGFPSRPVYNCHAQACAPSSSILEMRGFKRDYYGWYRPSKTPGGYGYDPNAKDEAADYYRLSEFFKKTNDPSSKTLPAIGGSGSKMSDADIKLLRDWINGGMPSGNQTGRYTPSNVAPCNTPVCSPSRASLLTGAAGKTKAAQGAGQLRD